MKFNDIKKAIATCDSKYIASISHNKMFFTKEEDEAFCSILFFIEEVNKFLWDTTENIDSLDIQTIRVDGKDSIVFFDYNEVEEYNKKECYDNWLEGLDNDDLY